MLLSSMDHLGYYSMQKDNFLEIDTSSNNGYLHHHLHQQQHHLVQGPLGSNDDGQAGSPTYLNEENSPKNGTKSSLYKTELCKRFSEFGNCRYGGECFFFFFLCGSGTREKKFEKSNSSVL